ncbi:MAG: ROK family protein [Acetivibrionales bacterium]|jgi:N-acetylglucosamine repressor
MTRKKAGNNQFLKKYNEAQVLNLIRIRHAVSRADLSEATGLSPTAIGVIVSGLIERGYIHEIGTGESRGGRKPVLLKLKPDSYYSVGVDVDTSYMNIVLMDSTGRIIFEDSAALNPPVIFEDFIRRLQDSVTEVIGKFSVNADRLLGVGISVPGLIDVKTQQIILAPNLGWKNADIIPRLDRLRGVPLYIENEAMASAMCESWVGMCQDVKNFVCINVESGIGAGIFTSGEVYRGADGSAGEVGHIMVDENGPKCGCGNYGCLETVASIKSIVEKAKKLVRQGTVSMLNEIEDVDTISIDSVIKAAREGDEASRNILNESARYIGIAISYIVNTLNPSKIVIGKEFVKYADLVMDQVKNVVSCKALEFPASKVEIVPSQMGCKSSVYGAAIIPIKALFGK